MEFALFQLAPWRDPKMPVQELIRGVVDQVRLAEDVGFDAAWFAEHHFSNLSVSPSPLMAAAHCGGVTSRIRLGVGVAVLPLYQPMRLVEEIAYADILTGGRLNVGVGCGSQNHESIGLGTDISLARARWNEAMDIMEMAFDTGEVTYQGEHFKIPQTAMAVMPEQRPHPPIFVAGMAEEIEVATRIGERGYTPFASAQWMPAAAVAKKRDGYLEGWKAAGHDPATMPFAVQRVVYVAENAAEAREVAEQARYTGRIVAAAKSGKAEFQGCFIAERPLDGEQSVEEILDKAMIGDAEHVAQMIVEDARALGTTHFSCFMHLGGTPVERVKGSIRRFGEEVIPLVRKALGETAAARSA